MKKKETFLQLHEKFMLYGLKMHADGGLCEQIFNNKRLATNEIFKDFIPDEFGWWAYGKRVLGYHTPFTKTEYTPLRQNIILFCAAINGEL